MQRRDLVSMFILVIGMCSTLSILFMICLLSSCSVATEKILIEEAEIVLESAEFIIESLAAIE